MEKLFGYSMLLRWPTVINGFEIKMLNQDTVLEHSTGV